MRSAGIRLGIDGKGQVISDLNEIGRTGDAAFDRTARSAKRSGEEAQAAIAKAERDMRKLETLMPGLNPGKLDMNVGVRDKIGKSAEESATIFAAAYAKMEQRAEHLREVIDPLYAAQKRHNTAIGEARTLMAAGVISLDDYSKMAWHLHQSLDGTAGVAKKTGSSFAAAAPQIQDLFTQISMGGNALNAFAVQGGQLIGQLQHTQGAVGNFARFMMGPWGVAIQVGLMVLGPLVSKLWEESEASKKAKEAAAEHRKAILDLADAQGKAIQTAERKQAVDIANIKLELDATLAVRKRTEAELEAAKARLVAARTTQANSGGTAPGLMSGVAGVTALQAQTKIDELTTALKTNAGQIAQLQDGFQTGFNRLVGMKVDSQSTPQSRVQAQYDRDRAAAMESLSGGALATRLRSLNAARDAELERIQKAEAAERKLGQARADTETLTSNTVAKMLRDAIPGVHVTSTTGGKHVKNSYHYRNQAVDFVPAGGMASMTKADVRQIFESRGIDVVELLGPGDKGHSDHFHVAWTKGKLSLDEFNDAAKRTQAELKTLASIIGEARTADVEGLLKDRRERYNAAVRDMVGSGDPLAGKIATGQQIAANDNVDREEDRRRLEAGKQRIQSLASFYQSVFNGGTNSIWDMFRQMGMRTLSDLLAKWTVGKSGDGAGGLLGAVANLFGRGGGNAADTALGASIVAQANAALPKLASGTENWGGGAALLGEHGPERAWLPRGTRVTPAGETRRAANDDGRRGPTYITVNANDAVLADTVRGWVAEGIAVASTRGAAGGAAMANAESAATATRRLGRRW